MNDNKKTLGESEIFIDNMKSIRHRKRNIKLTLNLLDGTKVNLMLEFNLVVNPIFRIENRIYKVRDCFQDNNKLDEIVIADELYIQDIK